MGQYSYTQPSSSIARVPTEDCGFDPEEVSFVARWRSRSGKFRIPDKCLCGLPAVTQTSTTELNPGRIFYACKNHKDGGYHIFKWWDEAVSEKIREIRSIIKSQSDCIHGIGSGEYALEVMKSLEAVKSLEVASKSSLHVKSLKTELVQLKELMLEKRFGGFDVKSVVILVSVIIVGFIALFCITRF